jgi:hypothetical protein
LSPLHVVKAVQTSGVVRVRAAIPQPTERFKTAAGSYRLENKSRDGIATRRESAL